MQINRDGLTFTAGTQRSSELQRAFLEQTRDTVDAHCVDAKDWWLGNESAPSAKELRSFRLEDKRMISGESQLTGNGSEQQDSFEAMAN